MERIDKNNYYLDIAETVLERSTCMRRQYGALIVKNDEIVSTGYNGAPRGRENCIDMYRCVRAEMNIPSGQRYELCRSVHAEMNAIISAARKDTLGATLFLVGRERLTGELLGNATPCSMCRRVIINAGIHEVVIRTSPTEYVRVPVRDWVEQDDTISHKAGTESEFRTYSREEIEALETEAYDLGVDSVLRHHFNIPWDEGAELRKNIETIRGWWQAHKEGRLTIAPAEFE